MKPPRDATRRTLLWHFTQVICQGLCVLWLALRVYGKRNIPTRGAAMLVGNHQSYLDPVLLGVGLERPLCYVARESLFRWPVLGRLFHTLRSIPIDREGGGSTALRTAIERLEEGYLIGIFPEGTRTSDGSMRAFKPGFVTVLRRAKVPIVPVGIAGAFEALPRGSAPRLSNVRVVYGEAIPFEQLQPLTTKDRLDELVALVESRVAGCFAKARALCG